MEDSLNNEEEFLLKWNNHQSNLIGVFKDWLRDESFVDITLVCGGEAVSGHKVVLAACSPLLNRILHDNPCRHPVVILNDVCSTDMKALLKFIYHGEVSVSQGELASFLKTADNLQIKGLAEGRETEEKKRKDKDEMPTEGAKKRKTDRFSSNSHEQSRTHSKSKQESVASSPKSDTKYVTNKDMISSLSSHNQLPSSGGVYSNSVNQMLTNTNLSNTPILEQEYDISTHNQNLQPETLVVKEEPLDYGGEIIWQDGNSHPKKENLELGDSANTTPNASSSNSSSSSSSGSHNQQQMHSTTLPFAVLHSSLESFGSGSTADILQKNIEIALSVDEKKSEEENKTLPLGSEELNQSNFIGQGVGNFKKPFENATIFLKEDDDMEILCDPDAKGVDESIASVFDDTIRHQELPCSSFGSYSLVTPFTGRSITSQAYYSMNGTLLSCTSCSFQSRNPYTFNRHLRIHFGNKEFKCNSCDYASTRKDSLIRHARVRHFIVDLPYLNAVKSTHDVAFNPV